MKHKILLVGGGNMGTALLNGWQQKDFNITVVDPKPHEQLQVLAQQVFTSVEQITDDAFDVIVLAVKPQNFPDLLPALKKFTAANSLVVSIAGGKTMHSIAAILGNVAIIRVMPNTPALIGQGISVCIASPGVSSAQKQSAVALLQLAGDIVWIEDEEQMHAVTALSGSGPAYVFALIEAMQKAGEASGLPHDLAQQLAIKTVQGAGALALQSPQSPADLRRQVTSPGGTTEAALKVLLGKEGLDILLNKAITDAANRSRELG